MRTVFLFIILIFLPFNAVYAEESLIDHGPKKQNKGQTEESNQYKENPSNPLEKLRVENEVHDQSFYLGGRKYKKSEIVLDFINMIVTDSLWYENTHLPETSIENIYILNTDDGDYIRKKITQKYPWFSKFVTNTEATPNRFSVNKWKDEFSIAMGWPEDLDILISEEKKEIIENEIKRQLPVIEKITGLKSVYVSTLNESIDGLQYAKVRVIPTYYFGQKNVFKSILINPKYSTHPKDIEDFEQYLFSGIRFTPDISHQVEGYFLPNTKNEIDFAVCKVFPDLQEPLLRSIIRECLFRALGFPDVSVKEDIGIFSSWNKENSNNSKIFIKDGIDALMNVKPVDKNGKSIQEDSPKMITVNQDISEYDLLMLKLLYCKEVKASMGIYELTRTILEQNKCWQGEKHDN